MTVGWIWVMRHGETAWNAEGRLQGHTDTPLNDTGRAQALAAARLLEGRNIQTVVSSDLRRAHDTARAVGEHAGARSFHADHALRERSYGVVEGMTWDEMAVRHPEVFRGLKENPAGPVPGGESLDDVQRRTGPAFARAATLGPAGTVLVVTHGGVMRSWMRVLMGERAPKSVPNAVPYRFKLDSATLVDVEELS